MDIRVYPFGCFGTMPAEATRLSRRSVFAKDVLYQGQGNCQATTATITQQQQSVWQAFVIHHLAELADGSCLPYDIIELHAGAL